MKGDLDQLRNLDTMAHDLEEADTEPEVHSVSQTREQFYFKIASKK